MHQALKRKGPVTVPREFVFMDRAAIGLGGVFLHLQAELNFYRLFNEAIDDFLGREGGCAAGGGAGSGRAVAALGSLKLSPGCGFRATLPLRRHCGNSGMETLPTFWRPQWPTTAKSQYATATATTIPGSTSETLSRCSLDRRMVTNAADHHHRLVRSRSYLILHAPHFACVLTA